MSWTCGGILRNASRYSISPLSRSSSLSLERPLSRLAGLYPKSCTPATPSCLCATWRTLSNSSSHFRAIPRTTLHQHLRRRYSTNSEPAPPTSFPDPTRPDLFYHLVSPPTPLSSSRPAFALSFLPTEPPSSASSTVIGWLPAEVNDGRPGEEEGAGLNDFMENPKFRNILHEAIQAGLREGVDEIQINGATQTQQGWMHIHDDRNVPALGRIGDPDDILASVLVENGKILPDTYQPMPSYRLCTSDGLTQLTPGLAQKLITTLTLHAKSEKGLQ